jgi:hypothetical protein
VLIERLRPGVGRTRENLPLYGEIELLEGGDEPVALDVFGVAIEEAYDRRGEATLAGFLDGCHWRASASVRFAIVWNRRAMLHHSPSTLSLSA